MTNVRPGDRAIVIKANNPENVGAVVEVIQRIRDGHRHPDGRRFLVGDGEVIWEVESLGRQLVMRHPILGEIWHSVAGAADSGLRRLPRPDEVDDVLPAQDSVPVNEKEEVNA